MKFQGSPRTLSSSCRSAIKTIISRHVVSLIRIKLRFDRPNRLTSMNSFGNSNIEMSIFIDSWRVSSCVSRSTSYSSNYKFICDKAIATSSVASRPMPLFNSAQSCLYLTIRGRLSVISSKAAVLPLGGTGVFFGGGFAPPFETLLASCSADWSSGMSSSPSI